MRILVAGALGEVGRSVSIALVDSGHEVLPVSSRAPIRGTSDAIDLAAAVVAISEGRVDAVMSAAGRGDRRAAERTGLESTSLLAEAAAASGVRSVLLSTTRVLEGWACDIAEDAAAQPLTPYAQANADNETLWLGAGGSSVLRITNYVCAPSSRHSPQALLLPWSLVTEGVETGRIGVRSGASLAKEFVDAQDVARAVGIVLTADDAPRMCATAPGALLTMRDLAEASADAVALSGKARPAISFGVDGPAAPVVLPGWLSARGWSGGMTRSRLTTLMSDWLSDQ